MKFILLIAFASLTLSNVFAQAVTCYGVDADWKISFEMNESSLSHIKFYKNGDLVRKYNEQEMSVSRLRFPFSRRGIYIYEVNFEGIQYLNLEREFSGNIMANTLRAKFLLTNNPVGFQNHAECSL